MFGFSPLNLMAVVVVTLLLLGPDKLPEVADKLGSSWRTLKQLQEKIEAEVRGVIPNLPSPSEFARITRSPANILNQLANMTEGPDEVQSVKTRTSSPPASVAEGGNRHLESQMREATSLIARPFTQTPPCDPSLN